MAKYSSFQLVEWPSQIIAQLLLSFNVYNCEFGNFQNTI
jgi:hypothetical protein